MALCTLPKVATDGEMFRAKTECLGQMETALLDSISTSCHFNLSPFSCSRIYPSLRLTDRPRSVLLTGGLSYPGTSRVVYRASSDQTGPG
jgi:hypothetical protein